MSLSHEMSQPSWAFPVTALILCGGRGRRMGRDKAWLPWRDRPMLQHLARRFELWKVPVHIVAQVDQRLPELPSNTTVSRDRRPHGGPALGLIQGLEEIRDATKPLAAPSWIWATSCDSPEPVAGCLAAILDRVPPTHAAHDHPLAIIPRDEHRSYPLNAFYQGSAASMMRALADDGELRLRTLVSRLPTRWVELEELRGFDPRLRTFWNINAPEDYQRYQQELAIEEERSQESP